MVTNAFHETTTTFTGNIIEEPNIYAKRFYDLLDAANQLIYVGCKEGLSKLSLTSNIKNEHNLTEICMDSSAELFKEYLPEDNLSGWDLQ